MDELAKQGVKANLSLEDFGPGEDGAKVRDQGAYLRQLIG